ncbi:MAG: outer membrane beta-barrel protein [Bacteroidetes bacterium]|nr:outer membrane beta-barrel protein [Bacteroidota bacterium]
MKKLFIPFLFLLFFSADLSAQRPSGPPGGSSREQMNVGRFYGKIVDEKGKGVEFAAVQLYSMRFDTVTKSRKEKLISGQITDNHGDFSLEKLPVFGEFIMRISYLGYEDLEKNVTFGLKPGGDRSSRRSRPSSGGGGFDHSRFAGMADKFDVDLGNIPLTLTSSTLDEVEVRAERAGVTLALDRKVYRVDKNVNATGGTAEDALRNVPSLSIDIDGNLTLRNGSPQIFIDGRPTTLTLDQIAAEEIESVEVITNPSAKYDASGGQAGIVNLVLKKERRIGYNGSVRINGDSEGSLGGGGDINLREGKFNVFMSGFYSARKGTRFSETTRNNYFGNPFTNVFQDGERESDGSFGYGRAGVDWFIDNRNTLTFQGNFMRGSHGGGEMLTIRTDSLTGESVYASSTAIRNSPSDRTFENIGGSILYKHLFPKKGRELTADLNYNSISFLSDGNYTTQYLETSWESRERQEGDGGTDVVTMQADYVDPIGENMKIEMGVRASIRNTSNNNYSSVYNPTTSAWDVVSNFADEYKYDDNVYAAYTSFSHKMGDWGYMAGLRVESSQYKGELQNGESTFSNEYPFSLFPSLFITRDLNEEDNLQLSYTRRIKRPHFFQLMPFTDFSDSLNLRRGNPNLVPTFFNSFEFTYLNLMDKGHSLLVSAYYKQAFDLITSYQFTEYNEELEQDMIISSYTNSNTSQAYGLEVTLRNPFLKRFELTSNVNVYNSKVDASNVESGLINEQFSWYIKENLTAKLPANFTLQVSGEYRSKAAFSPSSSSGRGRGHHRGSSSTAQGYTLPSWFVDVALRKDFFNKKLNLTVNVSDIFSTRKYGSYTLSDFFEQESIRYRNPQTVRVSLSYRFGKPDTSLFKRKNMKVNMEGSDMMQ